MIILVILFSSYVYFYLEELFLYKRKNNLFIYLINKINATFKLCDDKDSELRSQEIVTYNYNSSPNELRNKELNRIIIDNLYKENPLIEELLPNSRISFSSRSNFEDTSWKLFELSDHLQNEYNHFLYRKIQIFDPRTPLKKVFLLPSTLLSWFGVDLKKIPARVFSLLSFTALLVIKQYGSEIFTWLLSLFM